MFGKVKKVNGGVNMDIGGINQSKPLEIDKVYKAPQNIKISNPIFPFSELYFYIHFYVCILYFLIILKE